MNSSGGSATWKLVVLGRWFQSLARFDALRKYRHAHNAPVSQHQSEQPARRRLGPPIDDVVPRQYTGTIRLDGLSNWHWRVVSHDQRSQTDTAPAAKRIILRNVP